MPVSVSPSQVLWDFVCLVFSLFSPFLSYRRLQMVLNGSLHKNIQIGLSQVSILDPAFLLLYIIVLPDSAICNIPSHTDDTTLYTKCDQNGASDLWQQL